MPILVTGATGLVGNNVVRLLCDSGAEVRALVRAGYDEKRFAGLDVEMVEGDLHDIDAIARACRGASAVIHAAGLVQVGWTEFDEMRRVNVAGTRNIAEAARDAGARMIHVSSINALGVGKRGEVFDEESPHINNVPCNYVVSKREAESAVLELVDDGLDAAIVNPGYMLGPWDWSPSSGQMLIEVARTFTLFAPAGGVAVGDVRDVAAAIVAAIERGKTGRRYILAGHNLTYLEIWKLMAKTADSSVPFLRLDPLTTTAVGLFGDLATKLRGREGAINSAALRMSRQMHFYSSARAEAELGFRIRPIEETVADAWRWFQEHGYC